MLRHAFAIVLGIAAVVGCERSAPPGETTTAAAPLPRASALAPAPTLRSAIGFLGDIDALTRSNEDFRHVLYTARGTQLVLMSVPPGDHIGEETHDVDQFLRVEGGRGELVLSGTHFPIHDGSAMVVPAGQKHDVISTGTTSLKLYTIYAPPHHRDGVVHRTRADAHRDSEHFDGKTTP